MFESTSSVFCKNSYKVPLNLLVLVSEFLKDVLCVKKIPWPGRDWSPWELLGLLDHLLGLNTDPAALAIGKGYSCRPGRWMAEGSAHSPSPNPDPARPSTLGS